MADPTEVEQDDDHTESSVVKELRAKAKRVEQAETRAAELERKLALSEAGLTGLSDKQVKALLATHEGDVTAESFKATATELGFGQAATTPLDEMTDPAQVQRDQEVQVLSQFAGTPGPTKAPDAGESMRQAINDFQGDFQQYKSWVMENADSILGE